MSKGSNLHVTVLIVIYIVMLCCVSCKAPRSASGNGTPSRKAVTVANFGNPFMDKEAARAADTLLKILREHRIDCGAAGSRGFVLVIWDPERAAEARNLIRDAIAKYQLKASVNE